MMHGFVRHDFRSCLLRPKPQAANAFVFISKSTSA